MSPQFFKALGIESPPERGDYLVDISTFAKEHLKLEAGEPTEALLDQQARTLKRPWSAKEYPNIASWLKANEKPLAVVIEATRLPDYFNPIIPQSNEKRRGGLLSALLPGVQKCREFAYLLAARAMLHLGEGRSDDAWQDLLACHRLGRLVGRGATLIEGLVGVAIEQIASNADNAFLDRVRLTSKQAQACLRDIQGLPPLPLVADKVSLGERFMLLDTVQMIQRFGFKYLEKGDFRPPERDDDPKPEPSVLRMDWDPTLRLANRWYDRIAATLRIKGRAARQKQLNELDKELRTLKEDAANPGIVAKLLETDKPDKLISEAIGNVLISMMLPAFNKVQQAADRAEQVERNLHVAFALAVFKADEGSYPKELKALMPKYLPQVPNDLFSGKALIYRPTEKGYLLYSIGQNGKDDGGHWYDDDPPGDDPSVRIPLPELKQQQR